MHIRFILTIAIAWLGLAAPAWADVKIATVDFQRALNEVSDGEAARAKLEGMFAQKQAAIESKGQRLQAMQAEYEKQALMLSEAARAQKEQELYQAQMEYQNMYMQSEGEMQQMYMVLMEDLIAKMRAVCEQIGKEQGYTLVIEIGEGGVVYSGATDLTDELIKRYNAKNAGG